MQPRRGTEQIVKLRKEAVGKLGRSEGDDKEKETKQQMIFKI